MSIISRITTLFILVNLLVSFSALAGQPSSVPPKDKDGDGYTTTQGDCNDANKAVNLKAIEICDGIDNNCNGQIDENQMAIWWIDRDKDGLGNDQEFVVGCPGGAKGFSLKNTDCDDNDSKVTGNCISMSRYSYHVNNKGSVTYCISSRYEGNGETCGYKYVKNNSFAQQVSAQEVSSPPATTSSGGSKLKAAAAGYVLGRMTTPKPSAPSRPFKKSSKSSGRR